jgi:hypothetical protein
MQVLGGFGGLNGFVEGSWANEEILGSMDGYSFWFALQQWSLKVKSDLWSIYLR